MVCTGARGVVMGQQHEQEWAQHTPLWGTGPQHGGIGSGAADLDCLGPLRENGIEC